MGNLATGNARVNETAARLTRGGGPMDYGADNLRLLVHVVRALAEGRPVTPERLAEIVDGLGCDRDGAERFLGRVAERDGEGNVVGALGLSLGRHPYRFTVGGVTMTTWCAQDTLFLPVMLQQTATVECESPLSKTAIRMTVTPGGVTGSSPAGAVMSTVIIDPDEADLGTSAEIQMTFCRMVHFFASPEEAGRWAAGRDDIETLSLDEAFDLGSRLWPEAYAYARSLPAAA